MESSQSTEALIALEDEAPDVLFEVSQLAPVHLWPLLRMSLARTSANQELGTAWHARRRSRFQYPRTLATQLILPNKRSSRHVPSTVKTLFIVNGTTINSTPQGQENWLVGEFAALSPTSSAILQDREYPTFPAQGARPVFANTFSDKDLALRVGLAARKVSLSNDAVNQVRRFVREVVAHFDFPVESAAVAKFESSMLAASQRLAPYQRIYARFLDRIDPKTVVMGNASYTNRPALLPLLRERNIAVYEPQHGWIGPSHAAYNFGAAFAEPELKVYLPDALLTFGDHWSESIRHPSVTVAIGKAALEKAVARTRTGINAPDRVLLVSSIYRTEELVALARLLRKRLEPGLKVVVRPHPSERPSADNIFAAALDAEGIELDDETDLYRSLARATTVVGHASTVLFEALPFGIPTLIIDSPLANLYTPREVFGERLTVDAMGVDRILQAAEGRLEQEAPIDVARIWKPGAVGNFNAFINSVEGAATDNA